MADDKARSILESLGIRDPNRVYGAVLPVSSPQSDPTAGSFDWRGGISGDILGLLAQFSRAQRGESFDPHAVTAGTAALVMPDLAFGSLAAAHSPEAAANLLRSVGGGKGVSDVIKNMMPEKAPSGGLKESIQRANAEIVSPESTAYHARMTSPEGKQYEAQLNEKRQAWTRVSMDRAALQDTLERMREPGLTDEGIYKWQKRVTSWREKIAKSMENAAKLGVNPDDPFPVDERLRLPHGSFPGDEKYAKHSFAPPGFPFDLSDHAWHDPTNWVP